MIWIIKIILPMTLLLLGSSINPVKTSMFLLILSSIIFLILEQQMGSAWMPSIFYMLFMGGILIMFMILSSMMPNEKSFKIKTSLMLIILTIMISMITPLNHENTQIYTMIKYLIQSSYSILIIMMFVLMYFFSFLSIISKEKSPLRSTGQCYKKK